MEVSVLDVQSLKDYIINNDLVEEVLKEIGCHSIKRHGEDYITCANLDGDNKSAITIYLNENLTVINYTRQIAKNKRTTDIFDLVMYNKECTFPDALKFTCNLFGLDFYSPPEELPQSLQIIQLLKEMTTDGPIEDSEPLKPIDEKILSYYMHVGNKLFEDDNIDLDVQREFEIGYDPYSNYITIALRDAIGTLTGIKGRWLGKPDEHHPKYLFLEKCAKSKMLHGYWQNREYVKNSKYIFICEAEKAVLQLASMGVRNAVAIGSKTISKTQVELITRTGCTPIIAFDKDVKEEELHNIANMFLDNIHVKAIIDKNNILDEKESPSDEPVKWLKLVKNNIYTLK